MSHFTVATMQNQLRGLTKLQQRTHRDSDSSSSDGTERTPPVPVPRRNHSGRHSPVPRLSPTSNDDAHVAKPRPSSYNGEDSLKQYEIDMIQKASTPQLTEGRPIPKPRTKTPNKDITHSSNESPRQPAYSKGTKEYKQQQKLSSPRSTGMSPLGTGMSPGTGPSPLRTGMSPRGTATIPHGLGGTTRLTAGSTTAGSIVTAPDMSILQILDLDSCPSLRQRYVGEEIDLAEVSVRTWERDERRSGSPELDTANISFDTIERPKPNARPRSPSPPPKPPRDRSRKTSEPVTSPYVNLTLDRSSFKATEATDDDMPQRPIQRSVSTTSGISVKSKRGVLRGTLDRIRKSPIFSRKHSDSTLDIDGDDDDTVTSQTGVLKAKTSPLHSVSVKNITEMLKNPAIDPNARDDDEATPLHFYVSKPRRSRHALLSKCLQSGREFDINALDRWDNTPLHIAAQKNDLQYVRILVAFGANMFLRNYQGKYPYELASPSSPTGQFLAQFPQPVAHEQFSLSSLPDDSCSLTADEIRNRTIGELMNAHSMPALARLLDEEIVRAEKDFYIAPEDGLLSFRHRSEDQVSLDNALTQQRFYLNGWKKTAGNRILFLDGGGTRGLILLEILMELEERTGCKVTELFDWIVGTSTGAVIALGLVYAKMTLAEMKQLCFQIKNEVFPGTGLAGAFLNKDQSSENLEKIVKRKLGDAPMISVQKPKVMICVVNKGCYPLKVQFFNNFMTDNEELTHIPVWKAARATCAAPIYFTECEGKYVDGGVKANNPCQEAMRVIREYDESQGIAERHFLLSVSIGTGIYPDRELVKGSENKGFLKQFTQLKQLLDLFANAIGDSESTAQTFAVWCERARTPIPFFRFNPQLDEAISPAETDDEKIISLILKTKVYLTEKNVTAQLDELVSLFKRLATQSGPQ